MKLSYKFFCIAYVIVLLATGIMGAFSVNATLNTSMDAKEEQFVAANKYACDSFMSFIDVTYGELKIYDQDSIEAQIIAGAGMQLKEFDIKHKIEVSSALKKLSHGECYYSYAKEEGVLLIKSVCCIESGGIPYYLMASADCSDIEAQRIQMWRWYGIAVFLLAAVSGVLLFVVAYRVALPINRLSLAVSDVAKGDYGKTISIKNGGYEIKQLSDNFNKMSLIIQNTISAIKDESEKQNMFVANLAHEMKTPMTAIIGYAEMLNSYDLTPQESKRASKAIYKEGKRLEKLSLQLLDLYVYRNDSLSLEPVALNSVADQLQSTLMFHSKKHKVNLDINLHNVWVKADSVLLLSLIYNLADNAFKASREGECIYIFSEDMGNEIKITVKDNGRGISPENIRLLTEPFFREDKSRSRRLGGAGLGLTLCKEIARLHNSQLHIESSPNVGTSVWFTVAKEVSYE